MYHLALTIGDPTGIGPEITAKTLARRAEFGDTHFTVIGSQKALQKSAAQLDITLPHDDAIQYKDIAAEKPGAVSYLALEEAARLLAPKVVDALVTAPISKKNLAEAGYEAHGHTEILENFAQTYFKTPDARAEMLFVYKKLRLLLLTRHIPLSAVPEALGKQGAVARPLKTLISFLRNRMKIDEIKIAMLSLNPHAGEVGGDEEKKYILPVIYAVNAIGGTHLGGPFAADAFFRNLSADTPHYDAIVAPYHDQGLIPFKMLAGYGAVNLTIGLPFIRTSVSHGTAEDIAGQGIAREDSLVAAIHEARTLLSTN